MAAAKSPIQHLDTDVSVSASVSATALDDQNIVYYGDPWKMAMAAAKSPRHSGQARKYIRNPAISIQGASLAPGTSAVPDTSAVTDTRAALAITLADEMTVSAAAEKPPMSDAEPTAMAPIWKNSFPFIRCQVCRIITRNFFMSR